MMNFRHATPEEAPFLASLNQQLIREEGHRNRMTLIQLAERMALWLAGDYKAMLFEEDDKVVGYTLFQRTPEHVYVRQFYIAPEYRRKGVGRAAMSWLWANVWTDSPRLRVEVLSGNAAALAFWRAIGAQEYSVTLEAPPPAPSRSPS